MELSLTGICKSFGAGNVLDGVDFSVKSGEICALLGENGAGKSTLMNIVGGVYTADAGTITIDGREVSFASPAAAQAAGIAFIHQELNLINDLTVYENLYLSAFLKKGPFLDSKEMIRRARRLLDRFGLPVDPTAYVRDLDSTYKQLVAVARALQAEASLIIMDEPTTAMSSAEAELLFEHMRALRDKGVAIIFISHKLDEVMAVCDRYTVLRGGVVVSAGNVADVTTRQIAEHMVGHAITLDTPHTVASYGKVILQLEYLSDKANFFDISLILREGEVLGVTGLLGDGRSELFATVAGVYGDKYTGRIRVDGHTVRNASPHEAVKHGIAYMPKNRAENAILTDMSLMDNQSAVVWEKFRRLGLLDEKQQEKTTAEQTAALHIRANDPYQGITTLSGGNQQKALLAKWLLTDPRILILDNPTQGVDVGTKEEIYTIIERLAADGMAVVVLSAEVGEIIRVCDRCAVMYRGRVAGVVEGDDMNEKKIMRLATGAQKGARNGENI